jgi:hypothetical protein
MAPSEGVAEARWRLPDTAADAPVRHVILKRRLPLSVRVVAEALEVPVEELLCLSRGREMRLVLESDWAERSTERLAECLSSVSLHGQATARFRSVESEGRNDDMASDRDGVGETSDVPLLICGIGQEVEHRAVVPKVEHGVEAVFEYVLLDPCDVVRSVAESTARVSGCDGGHVEDSEIRVSLTEEVIHQFRGTAADVHDCRIRSKSGGRDE